MIELKHFIAQTLTEIVEGVIEAQDRVSEHGASVSPKISESGVGQQLKVARTQAIEFDVEVTTADSSSSKKGLNVFVAPLAAGKHRGWRNRRAPRWDASNLRLCYNCRYLVLPERPAPHCGDALRREGGQAGRRARGDGGDHARGHRARPPGMGAERLAGAPRTSGSQGRP
jgi:hypothetical protein